MRILTCWSTATAECVKSFLAKLLSVRFAHPPTVRPSRVSCTRTTCQNKGMRTHSTPRTLSHQHAARFFVEFSLPLPACLRSFVGAVYRRSFPAKQPRLHASVARDEHRTGSRVHARYKHGRTNNRASPFAPSTPPPRVLLFSAASGYIKQCRVACVFFCVCAVCAHLQGSTRSCVFDCVFACVCECDNKGYAYQCGSAGQCHNDGAMPINGYYLPAHSAVCANIVRSTFCQPQCISCDAADTHPYFHTHAHLQYTHAHILLYTTLQMVSQRFSPTDHPFVVAVRPSVAARLGESTCDSTGMQRRVIGIAAGCMYAYVV